MSKHTQSTLQFGLPYFSDYVLVCYERALNAASAAWTECAAILYAYTLVHSESSPSNPLTLEYALRYSEHTLNVIKYIKNYFFLKLCYNLLNVWLDYTRT